MNNRLLEAADSREKEVAKIEEEALDRIVTGNPESKEKAGTTTKTTDSEERWNEYVG